MNSVKAATGYSISMAKYSAQDNCCAIFRGSVFVGKEFDICHHGILHGVSHGCLPNPVQASKVLSLGNVSQLDLNIAYTRNRPIYGFGCCTSIDEVVVNITTSCLSIDTLKLAFGASVVEQEARQEVITFTGECYCKEQLSLPVGTYNVSTSGAFPAHTLVNGVITLLEDFNFTGQQLIVDIAPVTCIETKNEPINLPVTFRGKNCVSGEECSITLHNVKFLPITNFNVIQDDFSSLTITGTLEPQDGSFFDIKKIAQAPTQQTITVNP